MNRPNTEGTTSRRRFAAGVLGAVLLAGCTSSVASPAPVPSSSAAGGSVAGTLPAATARAGGPSASLVISRGRDITIDLPRVKCDKTVSQDGSSGLTLVFKVQGQPAWTFQVGASARPGQAFDHTVSMATDSNRIDDPYSGVANFLDSAGSTGSGWTVGGAHGVLLPGRITVNADLSGSIDAPMRTVQGADQLPDIRVVGRWTC